MYTRSCLLAQRSRPVAQRTFASSTLATPPLATFRLEKEGVESTAKESQVDKVRILSVDGPVATTSVSVYVNAGSRFENRLTSGSSHFLRKLAFRGQTTKSGLRTVRDLEHFGLQFASKSGRENISFHTKGPRFGSPSTDIAVATLRAQLSPAILEWQVNEIRPLVKEDVDSVTVFDSLVEAAHFEGFKDSGLSNTQFVPSWNVNKLDQRHLSQHVSDFFFGENAKITVVGTGVAHGEFHDLIRQNFSSLQSPRNPEISNPLPSSEKKPQTTTWHGGAVVRQAGPGSSSHVLVGYPGVSATSPDSHVFAVLLEILNSKNFGAAFNISYSDSGFFGLYSVGEGGSAGKVSEELRQLVKSAGSLTPEALESAKNFSKFKFLSELEEPLNLAQRIFTHGTSGLNISETVKKIGSVSVSDIQRIVDQLEKVTPVVVVSGDVRGV